MITESMRANVNKRYEAYKSEIEALGSIRDAIHKIPYESKFRMGKQDLEKGVENAYSRIREEWIKDAVDQLTYELQVEDLPYPHAYISGVSDLLAFVEEKVEYHSPKNLMYHLADLINEARGDSEVQIVESCDFWSLRVSSISAYYRQSRYCQTGNYYYTGNVNYITDDVNKAVLDCMRAFEEMMSYFGDPFTFQIDFYHELTLSRTHDFTSIRFQTPGSMLRSVNFLHDSIDVTFWDGDGMKDFRNKVYALAIEGEIE